MSNLIWIIVIFICGFIVGGSVAYKIAWEDAIDRLSNLIDKMEAHK